MKKGILAVIVTIVTIGSIYAYSYRPVAEPHCEKVSERKEKFTCYEGFYQTLVSRLGSEAAMTDLKTRYNIEPYVKTECHQLSHLIGRLATIKYSTVDQAYIHGDSACSSGYYHGVIEGVISKIGVEKITIETLADICGNLAEHHRYSLDHYNCVHGIGHGLMYINENRLFDALDLCDKLSDKWEQDSCSSGVFMENIIADNKNHFTDYLKPDDPLYPCNAVKENQKRPCYLMQSSYMLKLNGYDFLETFKLCGSIEDAYQDTCYQSLGRDASGLTLSDLVKTKANCTLGPNERARSNCVIGAVKDIVYYHHSDKEARVFCDSLSGNLKNICLETARVYYQSFNF